MIAVPISVYMLFIELLKISSTHQNALRICILNKKIEDKILESICFIECVENILELIGMFVAMHSKEELLKLNYFAMKNCQDIVYGDRKLHQVCSIVTAFTISCLIIKGDQEK